MPYCAKCSSTFALPPGQQALICPVCHADLRQQRVALDPAPPPPAAVARAEGGPCPVCGQELAPGDQVCIHCGTHISSAAAATAAPEVEVAAAPRVAASGPDAPGARGLAPLREGAVAPEIAASEEVEARVEIVLRLGDAAKWLFICSIFVPPLFPLALVLGAIAASAGSTEAARWVHRGVIVFAILLAIAYVVAAIVLMVLRTRLIPSLPIL